MGAGADVVWRQFARRGNLSRPPGGAIVSTLVASAKLPACHIEAISKEGLFARESLWRISDEMLDGFIRDDVTPHNQRKRRKGRKEEWP